MSSTVDDLLPDLIALRRDLHAHPELAFEERRTAGIVASALRLLGLEVHDGIASTGVVGTLRHGCSTRSIGLRADRDALPMVELGKAPHASRHAGVHHGCGHDGHTAMLLGSARLGPKGQVSAQVRGNESLRQKGQRGVRHAWRARSRFLSVTYRHHPVAGKPINLGTDRGDAIRKALELNGGRTKVARSDASGGSTWTRRLGHR